MSKYFVAFLLFVHSDYLNISTITVTTSMDFDSNIDGLVSLREAIDSANILTGHDIIIFDPLTNGDTIRLLIGTLPTVTDDAGLRQFKATDKHLP